MTTKITKEKREMKETDAPICGGVIASTEIEELAEEETGRLPMVEARRKEDNSKNF